MMSSPALLGVVVLTLVGHTGSQDFARLPMRVERIGHEVDWSPEQVPVGLDYANTTFLLNDVIMEDGLLFAYSAYFLSDKPIRFQVWRPVNVFLRQFKLMWEHRVVPMEWNTRVDTYISDLPNSQCLPVQNGDRLGVFIEEGPSSVSYIFNSHNPTALTHPLRGTETFAKINDVISFDALTFPYDYNVAAYVDTNVQRYANAKYDCPRERPGLRSAAQPTPGGEKPKPPEEPGTGARGPVGPVGLPGPRGIPGKDGGAPSVVVHPAVINNGGSGGDCSPCAHGLSLFNHTTLLVLVAWLTALTIINLCYLVVVCCRCTTRTTFHAERQNTRNTLVEHAGHTTQAHAGALEHVTSDHVTYTRKLEREMAPVALVGKAFEMDDEIKCI